MIIGIGGNSTSNRDPVETTIYTKSFMQSQDFVDILNSNIGTLSAKLDTSSWKNWVLGDDGYPTFERNID